MDLTWMAWTMPTAVFFISIGVIFAVMMAWEAVRPGGAPRHGLLRIETTRGDRLFISLLGSAFICLIWLAFAGSNLWWALGLCAVYAVCVFRWV
ncbi:putative small integral membrane protein [Rhodoligotrophos appendicifer]|uniref:DUF2160 domain-containing protein n=1 Tax=Rhodoligotrophos appendicifer TaxID=987056 RepID=UPI00117D3CF8|nr:DUF2160 domain-containing protein [Rhodoligotrophos appendicifer]